MKRLLFPLFCLSTPLLPAVAESSAPQTEAQAESTAPAAAASPSEDAKDAEAAAVRKAVAQLTPQKGEVTLHDGLARIALPEGFHYLNPDDSRKVLVDFWGNPPETAEDVLGMIIQAPESLFTPEGWGVIITFSDDGHVDDADAEKIDYAKLLKEMKADTAKSSKERVKDGYDSIELVGWAEPPHYDRAEHKIYWAKELSFGDNKENTLNYCIRILGRRGVLQLNTVAPISSLTEVRGHSADLLKSVDFTEGNRYADFNSATDRVAEYGIAALVAGGIAGKMGLFKTLVAILIAAKKFVVVGALALFGFVSKLFRRKSE